MSEPELVDVKLTTEERREEAASMTPGKSKGPEYPWGLSLSLDDGTLEKLGLDARKLKVGDELYVWAVAEVKSVSMRSDSKGEDESSVSLQIIKLACSEEEPEPEQDDGGEMARERGTHPKAKRTMASYYGEGKED